MRAHTQVKAILLATLMVLMTQVGFIEQFNSISSEKETQLPDETSVSSTGSNFSTLTSAVDGAALSFDVAMTPITLNYTSQAPPTSVSSGNNTTWAATCVSSTCSMDEDGVFREAGNYLIYADAQNIWATDASREYWLLKSGITHYHTSMNNMVYFESNNELWKTDGTINGTVNVSSINPFKQSESGGIQRDQEMTVLNNEIYFPVSNATNGAELWKSDGTNSGTVKVMDLTNWSTSLISIIIERFLPTVFNNKLVFMSHNYTITNGHKWQLLSTDGTASGTSVLHNDSGALGKTMIVFQNELYFQENNKSLMKTDGTASGSTWVFDQYNHNSAENSFFVWENHLYFNGWDVTNYTQGKELWKTDGTTSGTVQVANFVSDTPGQWTHQFNGIGIPDFYAWNETHFAFNARTSPGQNSAEHLYITDGTENNTSVLLNGRLWTSRDSVETPTNGRHAIWIGDIAYYGVTSSHGVAFCRTDFSGAHLNLTSSVSETCFPDYNNGQFQFDHGYGAAHSWNNELYIVAYRPSLGNAQPGYYSFWSYAPGNVTLSTPPPVSWETDPVLPAGISISNGIISGTPSVYANNQTYTVYANQSGNSTTIDLWFSVEGISLSPASTTVVLTNNIAMTPITFNYTGSGSGNTYNGNGTVWQVTDINSISPSRPGYAGMDILVGDTLYFSAYEASSGRELWAHDTSNSSTWQVADINSGGSSDPGSYMAILVGDTIYFNADDGSTSRELWAHDTSNSSTWLVADINSGSYSEPGSYMDPILVGDTIYFDATDGSTGQELWAHDTSNSSTWQVADINSGGSSGPGQYMEILVGDTIYFSATDGSTGQELWAHDTSNSSTWQVADIRSGFGSNPGSYMAILVGDTIYFDAHDGSGRELWAHDTSNSSTWQVADIRSGGSSLCSTSEVILVGDTLYFCADDGSSGRELWAHDTSNSSTWQVADINSGGSSDPGSYMAILVGDTIYFAASDGSNGNGKEVWAHDTSNSSTWQVTNIGSGNGASDPGEFMAILVGDTIYYNADDSPGLYSNELWAHDTSNSSTWLAADINSLGNANPGFYMAFLVGDAIYFDAWDDTVHELWAFGSGNGASGPSNGPVTNATCEISPTLPAGITLTQGTCTISGTPTVVQNNTTYTIWANESGVSATATVDISVISGDSDGDGYPDIIDAFPNDPSEWMDTDGDGIGNNADPDDDNDSYNDTNEIDCLSDPLDNVSIPLDNDLDGICDALDPDDDNDGLEDVNETASLPATDPFLPDTDGDGVCDGPVAINGTCTAGPDAFPTDPSEWLDTDGDGIGNNADTDDDGDGLDDVNETASLPATDPLLPDTDGDGVCDGPVAINGTCTAGPDAFPTDPTEWVDTDGDGIGNNADTDDDNDGLGDVNETASLPATDPLLPDTDGDGVCDGPVAINGTCTAGPDAFPTDSTEWLDTDGDGIGNNADTDDDGDGLDDVDEISSVPPTDPLLADTDGDGICDGPIAFENICTVVDRDGDGIADEFDDFPDDPSAYLDTDGDGMPDTLNGTSTSDPVLIEDLDDDNDGLDDVNETSSAPPTDPLLVDTDGDGVCDGPVAFNGTCTVGPDAFPTDPSAWRDTDGDGNPDEMSPPSNSVPPLEEDDDDDNDGWNDTHEADCLTDSKDELDVPVDLNDDGLCDVNDDDWDDDGVSNDDETNTSLMGTDPWDPDTDDDGFCDGPIAFVEVCYAGPDPHPLDPNAPIDTDGDGLPDENDGWTGPPMEDYDDDNDGWNDTAEIECGTDPLDGEDTPLDTDQNGICDVLDPITETESEDDEDVDQSIENLSIFSMWSCCILLLILLLIFALLYRQRDEDEERKDPFVVLEIDESFDEEEVEEEIDEVLESTKSKDDEYDEIYGADDDAAISEKQAKIAELDAQLATKEAEIAATPAPPQVDFSTIGVATASDKDDLTQIKGIGPVIERKLNDAGIFTLEQLSKVTPEIENQIDEAIGNFPGRLSREKVFDQARKLLKD